MLKLKYVRFQILTYLHNVRYLEGGTQVWIWNSFASYAPCILLKNQCWWIYYSGPFGYRTSLSKKKKKTNQVVLDYSLDSTTDIGYCSFWVITNIAETKCYVQMVYRTEGLIFTIIFYLLFYIKLWDKRYNHEKVQRSQSLAILEKSKSTLASF